MDISQFLKENDPKDLAFVIGNGINHKLKNNVPSWENIMKDLWRQADTNKMPENISLPEIGDILAIKKDSLGTGGTLEAKKTIHRSFCEKLGNTDDIKECGLLKRLQEDKIPILTTNYDLNIEKSLGINTTWQYCNNVNSRRWTVYFGKDDLIDPTKGFGVWHIHGDIEHISSMCLTQSDYITYIKGAYSRVNSVYNQSKSNTINSEYSKKLMTQFNSGWLNIFFNKSLVFVGLGLGRDEIFLRWLLLKRRKHIKGKQLEGWYLYNSKEDKLKDGNESFLTAVGITPKKFNDYDSMYNIN